LAVDIDEHAVGELVSALEEYFAATTLDGKAALAALESGSTFDVLITVTDPSKGVDGTRVLEKARQTNPAAKRFMLCTRADASLPRQVLGDHLALVVFEQPWSGSFVAEVVLAALLEDWTDD
jgi:hypothetical protein